MCAGPGDGQQAALSGGAVHRCKSGIGGDLRRRELDLLYHLLEKAPGCRSKPGDKEDMWTCRMFGVLGSGA